MATTEIVEQRPVLELSKVCVLYGAVAAVSDVSFSLAPGRIAGLIGPNGSGKSSLLAALSGTRSANSGSIRLHGAECRTWRPWKMAASGVARTFQGTRLVPGLNVRENVLLGAEWGPRRSRGAAASTAVDEAMELCGITAISRDDPMSKSYGVQRLVELARAIAGGPNLLLLDEPTAGMDDDERSEIEEVLKTVRARGVTQLLVEHHMGMVARRCDEVFVLNAGRLIARGSADEVAKDPQVQEAYLGRRP